MPPIDRLIARRPMVATNHRPRPASGGGRSTSRSGRSPARARCADWGSRWTWRAVYEVGGRTTISPADPAAANASRRAPFVLECGPIHGSDGVERIDGQRRPARRSGDPPEPGVHAVEQERAHRCAVARRQRDRPAGRDDPRPIRVAEEDVVVFGQEAGRRRERRDRDEARPAGRTAPPAIVTEGGEIRPKALDDGPEAGQAGPRPDVVHGRRAERAEIAGHDPAGVRRIVHRAARASPPSTSRRRLRVRPQMPRGGTWTSGT